MFKFSFQYPLIKIWKKGYIYDSKKLLVFAKTGSVFQPNIREKGIFSVPDNKHEYPLRGQCPGLHVLRCTDIGLIYVCVTNVRTFFHVHAPLAVLFVQCSVLTGSLTSLPEENSKTYHRRILLQANNEKTTLLQLFPFLPS